MGMCNPYSSRDETTTEDAVAPDTEASPSQQRSPDQYMTLSYVPSVEGGKVGGRRAPPGDPPQGRGQGQQQPPQQPASGERSPSLEGASVNSVSPTSSLEGDLTRELLRAEDQPSWSSPQAFLPPSGPGERPTAVRRVDRLMSVDGGLLHLKPGELPASGPRSGVTQPSTTTTTNNNNNNNNAHQSPTGPRPGERTPTDTPGSSPSGGRRRRLPLPPAVAASTSVDSVSGATAEPGAPVVSEEPLLGSGALTDTLRSELSVVMGGQGGLSGAEGKQQRDTDLEFKFEEFIRQLPRSSQTNLKIPCIRCVLRGVETPQWIVDVPACHECLQEGSLTMKIVLYHQLSQQHDLCRVYPEYPKEELKLLPDLLKAKLKCCELFKAKYKGMFVLDDTEVEMQEIRDALRDIDSTRARWQADWCHKHDQHHMCRPEYLQFCTDEEKRAFEQVDRHKRLVESLVLDEEAHRNCPRNMPELQLLLHPPEDRNRVRALWRHGHNVHDLCEIYNQDGCKAVQNRM